MGEESKSNSQIHKTQAKSKKEQEIESSCRAWKALTWVSVCLNHLLQCLKNEPMLFFIPIPGLWLSLIASSWVSPGHIFPRCAPATLHAEFPPHGVWLWADAGENQALWKGNASCWLWWELPPGWQGSQGSFGEQGQLPKKKMSTKQMLALPSSYLCH